MKCVVIWLAITLFSFSLFAEEPVVTIRLNHNISSAEPALMLDSLFAVANTQKECLLIAKAGSKEVQLRVEQKWGKTIIDLRRWQGTFLEMSLNGGSCILVFSEEANVRVTRHALSAFICRAPSFKHRMDGYERLDGSSQASTVVRLSGWGGSLSLLTLEDSVPLDDRVKTEAGYRDIHFFETEDISRWIRYNRVEGLYLGGDFNSRRLYPDRFALTANAGYAISARLVEYNLAAHLDLSRQLPLSPTLAIRYGKSPQCGDDTRLNSVNENSLQMFLFGDDFRDYYISDYVGLTGEIKPIHPLSIQAEVTSTFYKGLSTAERFSLFGQDTNRVRSNPWIQEKKDRYVTFTGRYRTIEPIFPRKGVDLFGQADYSGGRIGSEFTYRRVLTDLRGYASPAKNTELTLRLLTGEVTGKNGPSEIASPRLFDFGGFGTVRGLPFREDGNLLDKNRIFTATAEVRHQGNFSRALKPACVFGWFPDLLFSFFVDAGQAWNTEDKGKSNVDFTNPLDEINVDKFYKTVGIGFSDPGDHLQINLTRTYFRDYDLPYDRAFIRFGRSF
ncbi:MAG: hypothetical protein A2293_03455 [Elusimicrobia bacterium RIFOXYB2_FULL_49_7]|nr:MAG: hypothetical protein A2293_03455 [Elusimicrobia bacterium RIFOXYB2_FULL_49_7]